MKITASSALDLRSLLETCLVKKGLDMVGIVDMACCAVLEETRELLSEGLLREVSGGGFRYREALTLIAGAEVEVHFDGKPVHLLVYVPGMEDLKALSSWYEKRARNPSLGVQQVGEGDRCLPDLSSMGLVVPAHAFTPFRGYYGTCKTLGDRLRYLSGLELGLSANSAMGDRLEELSHLTFLSNSDAHSLSKIGREHNVLSLHRFDFSELNKALEAKNGRGVEENLGFAPWLGKYYRSFCPKCSRILSGPPPEIRCPECGSEVIKGVLDRLFELADRDPGSSGGRPRYRHIIPPYMVPGIGPKTLDRLIRAFGSEMALYHKAEREELINVLGPSLGLKLYAALKGEACVMPGGGGRYGRVLDEAAREKAP